MGGLIQSVKMALEKRLRFSEELILQECHAQAWPECPSPPPPWPVDFNVKTTSSTLIYFLASQFDLVVSDLLAP